MKSYPLCYPLKKGFLALLLTCVSLAQAQTLEHAVKLMLYNEPEIQAANYDRLSSIEDWKIVRGDIRPQITLDGNAGYLKRDRSTDGLVTSTGEGLFSRQVGISVRQLLYDGGLVRQQIISAKRGSEMQELVERSMIEGRVVDLCEVYLEVIRTKEQVKLAQVQVNDMKDIRDMIKAQVGKGGNRADLALIDGRLSLAVNSVESQQLAYENALIRFVRLTGRPASRLNYPNVPSLPTSQSGLELMSNFDYQASVAALAAAEHKYKSTRGNRGPKIYLDAGGSVGEDVLGIEGRDNETSAMLTMSWDLHRGGANKALQKREHWQVRKAEELVQAAKEQAEYLSALLWKERQGSQATQKSVGTYVNRLEGVIADYREQFKVGRQDLLNILDVQGELYTARVKAVDARFNIDTTAYRIIGVQGLLTDLIMTPEGVAEYIGHNPDNEDEVPSDLLPVSGKPKSEAVLVSSPTQLPPPNPGVPVQTKRKLRLNPFKK